MRRKHLSFINLDLSANIKSRTTNPYGWNKDTAFVFVDQPAGVGFSYLDEGEAVPGDLFVSAINMQIFLQMFMNQVFLVHKEGPLVIAGESYAVCKEHSLV